MEEKIIELLLEMVEDKSVEIDEQTSIMEDLNLGSMEFFNVLNSIEDEFGITIEDDEIDEIETVQDLLQVVLNKCD